MGTRTGDIDPAVPLHLARHGQFSIDSLDDLLNKRSGLKGMAGHGDMRDILAAAAAGDEAAQLAFDVYVHRIKQYIGGYWAQLGHLDVIAFTAGVGENSAPVRAAALAGLEELGVVLDPERNESPSRQTRVISGDASPVTVLVVPTDEELEIARQTLSVVED
jgi:acetate kinase